jgi:nucleoside-diphosphate-sugar epimerase
MPTVLLTGSSGLVGRAAGPALGAAGWTVRPFDLDEGGDLLDEAAVRAAAAGCDAVVHAGALAHDSRGTPAEIVATNVLGTWHVLLAAEAHGVDRVVVFSSGQVFGFAEGEGRGEPDRRPVTDDHPRRASRPYGMSKLLVEEMCEAWTRRTGIPTIVLRPVMVLDEAAPAGMRAEDAELGAFVHVDDVAAAVVGALAADIADLAGADRHVRMLLCGPGPFDISVARRVLGWSPTRGWP